MNQNQKNVEHGNSVKFLYKKGKFSVVERFIAGISDFSYDNNQMWNERLPLY
jgi:hypothetical protein